MASSPESSRSNFNRELVLGFLEKFAIETAYMDSFSIATEMRR